MSYTTEDRDEAFARALFSVIEKEAAIAPGKPVRPPRIPKIPPALPGPGLFRRFAGKAALGAVLVGGGKMLYDANKRSKWDPDLIGANIGDDRIGNIAAEYKLKGEQRRKRVEEMMRTNFTQDANGGYQSSDGTILGHGAYNKRLGNLVQKEELANQHELSKAIEAAQGEAYIDPLTGQRRYKRQNLPGNKAQDDYEAWKGKYLAAQNSPLQSVLPFWHNGSMYWRPNNVFDLVTGRKSNVNGPDGERQMQQTYKGGQNTMFTNKPIWR